MGGYGGPMSGNEVKEPIDSGSVIITTIFVSCFVLIGIAIFAVGNILGQDEGYKECQREKIQTQKQQQDIPQTGIPMFGIHGLVD